MGSIIAITLVFVWLGHLLYSFFFVPVDYFSVAMYFHICVQTYFYTGLFITAHDAMHGAITQSITINNIFGNVATILFAGMSYKKLLKNHELHHKYPGTNLDPDYTIASQNFFIWWAKFMFAYITVGQLMYMALLFNLLRLFVPQVQIVVFWVLPALLSSMQLFYFGTYRPHKLPHTEEMREHRARTQKKNHIFAMISCYFFGYHREHHESPNTPWWQLYKVKTNGDEKNKRDTFH